MKSPEIPDYPGKPFDASALSDAQVIALSATQLVWADLSEHQINVLLAHERAHPTFRPLSEAAPQYLPAPHQMAKVKELFDWFDAMAQMVRRPGGIAWVEVELMMNSAHNLLEWAKSDPTINPRYRYRIDSPMDPDAQVPDHLPQEWT